MNILLTPELEEYARNQVAGGLYGSISELMREAVRMHREKNLEHLFYLHEIHKELAQATAEIDRGEIFPLNIKEMTEHVFTNQKND